MEEKVNWKGASGTEYSYAVYSKQTEFNPNLIGNYIFAKRTNKGWDAVYIGEGDIKTRTQDKTHLSCATKKGFTHYHVHLNNLDESRKREEEDLIKGNLECLEENGGCNKTENG